MMSTGVSISLDLSIKTLNKYTNEGVHASIYYPFLQCLRTTEVTPA
jgi:hypothetical protein